MESLADQHAIHIVPAFDGSPSRRLFLAFARSLSRLQKLPDEPFQRAVIKESKATLVSAARIMTLDRTRLCAAIHTLTDLVLQRWPLVVRKQAIYVSSAPAAASEHLAEKARIRRQELIKRDEQLAQPAVRRFIREMEQRRLHEGRFVSIFSLMRDGRELAQGLKAAMSVAAEARVERLSSVIDPYLQFVSEGERCRFTGLRLLDIWRYFRHTWTNQYTSVPGRTMMMLVRDRGARDHPVVGIAALSSPIVQIRERDVWIGWHPTAFLQEVRLRPVPEVATWLRRIVANALEDIYVDDLIEDGLISPQEIRKPTGAVVRRLVAEGVARRRLHHRFTAAREHKASSPADSRQDAERWVRKARSHLFRSKRTITLAELLSARLTIEAQLGVTPSAADLARFAETDAGARALLRVLRKAKADRVGIAMADITVCGAVPPYNPILGGKLVAMLAASGEVVDAYREKYASAESEIASSMAGRPVVRPSHLVFLGTSSLYGIGSSQYNRIRIPGSVIGGNDADEIRYIELGRSEAFGTSHYRGETVQSLVDLTQQVNGGQRVNSIFGEGVSPKLRKVREGLEVLGLPADDLLRHGRPRIIYGVPLARNVRDYLLGLTDEPEHFFAIGGAEATARIAAWWRERWLVKRITVPEVLAQVEKHNLVQPIRHGARVQKPPEDLEQAPLFDEL